MEDYILSSASDSMFDIFDYYDKIKCIKTMNLKSDKKNEFELSVYTLEDQIILRAKTKNIYPQKIYKKKYILQDMQKIILFEMCENMEDVLKQIKNYKLLENEDKLKIIENSNSIIFMIQLNLFEMEKCVFELIESGAIQNINNSNLKIDNMKKVINKLLNENKNLKAMNKLLEESNISLKKQSENLKEEMKSLNGYFASHHHLTKEKYENYGNTLYEKLENLPEYNGFQDYFGKIVGMLLSQHEYIITDLIENEALFRSYIDDSIMLLKKANYMGLS